MDVTRELVDIGKLIASAGLLMAVRKEVASVMKDGFVVTDGKHHPCGSKFEVVVRCGSDDSTVARRIRSGVPNIEVERIAEGVLGVRTARRVRRGRDPNG